MKLSFLHIMSRLGIMLTVVLSSAMLSNCTSDSELTDESVEELDPMMVTFQVMVPSSSSNTRASVNYPATGDGAFGWGDYFGGGDTDFDCMLIPKDFVVNLYRVDPTLTNPYRTQHYKLGSVREFYLSNMVFLPDGCLYQFNAILDLDDKSMTEKDLQDLTVKVIIIANSDLTDSEKNGVNPPNAIFNKIGQEEEIGAIPMWGVRKTTLKGIQKGKPYDLGEIWLLRSMAKVKVDFNRDATSSVKDMRITGARLIDTAVYGTVSPGTWTQASETKDITFDQTLNAPMGSYEVVTPVDTDIFTKIEDDGSIILYLPEQQSQAGQTTESMIQVYFTGGSGTIKFRQYANGKPIEDDDHRWTVLRNHFYNFRINSIPDINGELGVNWTVCSMTDAGVIDIPSFD